MGIVKQRRGQFIIIAALLIAIMIVSASTIMYGSVTYYRHERWEEYLAIIDNVKIGSYRTVEISLANYTSNNCTGNAILRDNLYQWQNDTKKAYAGFGVLLANKLTNDTYSAYGETINYSLGLACHWREATSFSAANSTFTVNITSVGLTGYEFIASLFLRMEILDALWYDDSDQVGVRLAVDRDGLTPVTSIRKANFKEFQVNGTSRDFTLNHYYDGKTHNAFVYELCYDQSTEPSSVVVTITVVDTRSIMIIGNATLTVTTAA